MKNLKKFIPPVKKPRLSGWLLTSVLLLGTIGLVSPSSCRWLSTSCRSSRWRLCWATGLTVRFSPKPAPVSI
ncbi:Phage protein [Enterobacter asburiae]|uniref:Phage protein n=1 Tax=Enterobacter asburiae TaxID=61645 RepID=A0A376FBD1_ENTAS|nr:Phage protein [Enterobacter asburiae]